MPSVQVNDISVYYEVHGSGEPLLLIGGLGTDLTLFAAMTGELAQGNKVIAFDNRGAGRTDKPDAPYSIPMMAEDALGVLDALGIERANVLGISMGGRIAMELTLAHPERVGKLVLISTSAAGRGKVTVSWPMRMMMVFKWLGMARDSQPKYARERQREATVTYDGRDRISAIQAPTLILHGRTDRTMPLADAELTHKLIAGSTMRVFSGGHLFFMVGQRQHVCDTVENFLVDT